MESGPTPIRVFRPFPTLECFRRGLGGLQDEPKSGCRSAGRSHRDHLLRPSGIRQANRGFPRRRESRRGRIAPIPPRIPNPWHYSLPESHDPGRTAKHSQLLCRPPVGVAAELADLSSSRPFRPARLFPVCCLSRSGGPLSDNRPFPTGSDQRPLGPRASDWCSFLRCIGGGR